MSSKVHITVIDDLDGTPDAAPVRFALDGVNYEIDLAPHNTEALHDAVAPFLTRARRVRGHRGTPTGPGRDIKRIREWAHANGHLVRDRGRISRPVMDAYDADHARG